MVDRLPSMELGKRIAEGSVLQQTRFFSVIFQRDAQPGRLFSPVTDNRTDRVIGVYPYTYIYLIDPLSLT